MKPHVLWIRDISWKFSCPSQPFPLKPSPPKGQHGAHELRVTQMLTARFVGCGNGLVSCCQAGCAPLCQLCPREVFNFGLCCCYPGWSWSLRELNYLWEVFPYARFTGSWLTDSVLWEGVEMQLHLISIWNQETKHSGLLSLIVCPLAWSALKSHAKIGGLRHYSFSPASCSDLMITLWMSPRWFYFQA